MTYPEPDPDVCWYCQEPSCRPCRCGHTVHSHDIPGLSPYCTGLDAEGQTCRCEKYEAQA